MDGKRVLITGAGSGIGREAARRLEAEGAELILLGRRPEALRETLPRAMHVALDHSDAEAVAAFAASCPPLDGMFLNAGQLATGSVEGTPTEVFDRMIAANLRGPWLLAHHLGPMLREGASVVLTGSNIGIRAVPDSAAYSVAKAGLHMLTRVLALEWAPRGIRCNAIAPGPVPTDILGARFRDPAQEAATLARLRTVNPLGRLGTVDEVAGLALHLLGPESTWTTGTLIPVDGGAAGVYMG